MVNWRYKFDSGDIKLAYRDTGFGISHGMEEEPAMSARAVMAASTAPVTMDLPDMGPVDMEPSMELASMARVGQAAWERELKGLELAATDSVDMHASVPANPGSNPLVPGLGGT